MFFTKTLLVSSACLAVASATVVQPGTPDGVYTTEIDGNGNKVNKFLAPLPDLPDAQKRDITKAPSAKFYARDEAQIDGAPPGTLRCTGAVVDDLQWADATGRMAGFCGADTGFSGEIHVVSNRATAESGAVAYICAYSEQYAGSNHCDAASASTYYGLINNQCHASRSGYYELTDWGITYGYTGVGQSFCDFKER